MDINRGLIAIGAGIAVLTGFMTGLGEGTVAAHALSETCAIYGLLVAVLLIFVY